MRTGRWMQVVQGRSFIRCHSRSTTASAAASNTLCVHHCHSSASAATSSTVWVHHCHSCAATASAAASTAAAATLEAAAPHVSPTHSAVLSSTTWMTLVSWIPA